MLRHYSSHGGPETINIKLIQYAQISRVQTPFALFKASYMQSLKGHN